MIINSYTFAQVATGSDDIIHRINCGGVAVSSNDGDIDWAEDSSANPSSFLVGLDASTYSTTQTSFINSPLYPVPASADIAALYQSERNKRFGYQIPVTNGDYTVNIYTAEIYQQSANLREFNIDINGSRLITNLDLFDRYGGRFYTGKESIRGTVTSSELLIEWSKGTANDAKASCIEIIKHG